MSAIIAVFLNAVLRAFLITATTYGVLWSLESFGVVSALLKALS